jgi:uncharacterized alkaline shock family protein YloU
MDHYINCSFFIYFSHCHTFRMERTHTMEKFYTYKDETIRALREVIHSVVETNLQEANYIKQHNQFVEKVFSSFQKTVYVSKGIHVEIENNQIVVKLTVNVFLGSSLMNDLLELQKRIYDDVFQLIGYKLHGIHIKVRNIINTQNKKTQ